MGGSSSRQYDTCGVILSNEYMKEHKKYCICESITHNIGRSTIKIEYRGGNEEVYNKVKAW